jgi:PAS domain S-box-containing protein
MLVKKYIGKTLAEMGFITKEQLGEALHRQKQIIRKKTLDERLQRVRLVSDARHNRDAEMEPLLGQVLTEMGFVSKEQLALALIEQKKSFEAFMSLENEKLGIAFEVGSLVNSTLNLAEVLHLIMKHANRVTNSVASTLMLLDEETEELVFSVPTGPKANELIDVRIPPGEGIAGWVAKHEKPLLVPDVKEDSRFYSKIDEISGFRTKSILCVPLKAKTKMIGVLEVINKLDGTCFTENDELLLSMFGYQVAVAIENARLYGELKDQLQECKQVEDALRTSEERFRELADLLPQTVFEIDRQGKLTYANRNAFEIFGYTQEDFDKGLNARQMFVSEDRDRVAENIQAVLNGEKIEYVEFTAQSKHNSKFPVIVYPRIILHEDIPVGIRGFLVDINEQKKAEEERIKLEAQLQQAQKMEAIGTLVGGIAHDFNNILGIIIGNTELALDDVPEWNPAHINVEEIKSAGLRAKYIVRQLLSYSRKADYERKPMNLIPVVRDSIKFLRATIPTTIDIRQDFQAEVDTILADPTQIHQVMINLCTNAAHAMEETGGVLGIEINNVILDEDAVSIDPDLVPGSYVQIAVRDTGQGILLEIIDRIFDPYFTTKEVGKGSGMGLSVVHGIIKSHKGAISADSEPGKGSTFHVYFPVSEDDAPPEPKPVEELPTGTEKILFIDDEKSIVQMAGKILGRLGYQVETEMSPKQALERFRSSPDRFDLVITDMTMPYMTGDKLVEEILNIRPDLSIILCTGFSEKISEEKAMELGIKAFALKPLDKGDFAITVRNVLDADAGIS